MQDTSRSGVGTGNRWRRGPVCDSARQPLLRQAPPHIARAAALVPARRPRALETSSAPRRGLFGAVLVGSAIGALVLIRLHGRDEGWPIALVLLALRDILGGYLNARTLSDAS